MLREGGHIAIVIDEGVLNLPSTQDVRSYIVSRFDILGIVSLPETAFMPYANVNASILFLRKHTAGHRSQQSFFGKAENIGRKSNGDDDVIYDERGVAKPNSDLPQILELWDAHLNGRSISPSETAFVTNVVENLQGDESLRLDFRYHHPSRGVSKVLLENAKYPILTLSDICEERNDSIIPSTEMQDQVILYTGLADIESRTGVAQQVPTPTASLKSAVKRYEPKDIVFARMRPNLRKVALMEFSEGVRVPRVQCLDGAFKFQGRSNF
ncbi:MAG: SAM-dependent DNA methyltransferase [Betaproteobacteria bacterium]|nr:SAM-dependent DNA methyltransferase [Betaproteobacteria bacterium]